MSANVQIDTSGSLNQQNNNKTNNPCNLIVNYLPQSVKEQDFNALFSKLGPLKSCKLMYDRQTGYSFGYGFVEYVNEEDAKKALETFNGYQIEHKRLKVALARPNCEDTKNTNLYIRNIPVSYDEQQLADLFSQFGDVIQVRLLRDQNTTYTRRIGFVIMATKQMAQIAIQNLDNTIPPNGGNEPIYVKYADEDGNKKRNPGGVQQQQYNNYRNNQQFNNYHNSQYQQNFNMMQSQSNIQSHINLGKIKSNRNNGHQNRYNPIGGANGGPIGNNQVNNGGINNPTNASNGNGYNPWNIGMTLQQQQGYSNFGNPNPLLGNSGFENLIGAIGGGAGQGNGNISNNTGYPHHPNIHPQMSQHGSNGNYLNAAAMAAAAAAAAAAGIGNSSSTGNLLDVGGLGMDSKAGFSYNSSNVSSTIYVYGIGPHASESDLYSLFSNYGRISRVNVIKNAKTGQSKGYGFVVFESFEEANLAIHSMNGVLYNNRPLQVSFKSYENNSNFVNSNNKNSKNKKYKPPTKTKTK